MSPRPHLPIPTVTEVLDLHPDVLWQRVCDTRQWAAWVPGIRAARATSQHLAGGTRGAVQVGSIWVPFSVRDFVHGETVAVRVAGLPGPRVTARPLHGGASVTVRGAPLGWARRALRALGRR